MDDVIELEAKRACGMVHVEVYSLMLLATNEELDVPAGNSVLEIIAGVGFQPHTLDYLNVILQGFPLPREQWVHVRPKAGTVLNIGVMPASDRGTQRVLATNFAVFGGGLLSSALGATG